MAPKSNKGTIKKMKGSTSNSAPPRGKVIGEKPKRHRDQQSTKSEYLVKTKVTKPAIRRLCRRAGVGRINGLVYKEVRDILRHFLQENLRNACLYTYHRGVQTISASDVVYGLRRSGITLYGFDLDDSRNRKKEKKK
jgi:histone H4